MKISVNEDEILHLDSVIDADCKFTGMTVNDAISEDRLCIMQMLKKGIYFGDDVLKEVGITKTKRSDVFYIDYNGIVLYSTDWPEEMLKKKEVGGTVISHDGERDEFFYQT